MKKKLLFVAAMAVLLTGAFSCGKKDTPLEKLVKEINAELPIPDADFMVTKIEYDGTDVTMSFDAIDEEFGEEVITLVNELGNGNVSRSEFVCLLLKGFMGHDLMNEMLNEGAGMVQIFSNKATGSSARLEISPEEIADCNEYYLQMSGENEDELMEYEDE